MKPSEQMVFSKRTSSCNLMQVICQLFLATIWVSLSVSCATAGVVLTTLFSFDGTNGMQPDTGIIQGNDGIFYGTTPLGGTNSGNGHGIVFRTTPDGVFTNLHSFSGYSDGDDPLGLALGSDGCFYGTTFAGGTTNYNSSIRSYGYGTVFKVTTNGAFTTLYTFSNSYDGGYPEARLALGIDGNLYGTTTTGGTGFGSLGYGTFFKISTSGKLTTLLDFSGTISCHSPLAVDPNGNLYCAAPGGYDGVLLKFSTNGAILWRTDLEEVPVSDPGNWGEFPYGLVRGGDDNFYGIAQGGGFGGNGYSSHYGEYGTFFKVTTNGTITVLHWFNNTNIPPEPANWLSLGSDGNLYGISQYGGAFSGGTLFEAIGTNIITLLSFSNSPSGPLFQGSDGAFYGTTLGGGTYHHGTLFRLSIPIPPVFQPFSNTGGALKLTWSAIAGQTYQLQYKTNLGQIIWNNLGSTNLATNTIISASDTNTSSPQRFYRVMILP